VPPICEALRRALAASGLRQRAFAARLGVTQQTVSNWLRDQEPKLDDLARIEEELELPRGYLLRDAGYVAEAVRPEDAIANDGRVSPGVRRWLVSAYLAAIGQNPR